MKGVMILPKYLEKLWTPKVKSGALDFNNVLSAMALFYYTMCNTFGFELRYANEVDVTSNIDVVVVFGVPYHNRPKLIPGLLDLNKNIKLVMFPSDIQCYDNKLCMENRIKVFKRCDLIITPVYEYFMRIYPQFMSKHKFVSNCFSTYERYTKLSFNEDPKMRCLLSGAKNPRIYPLRVFVKNSCSEVDYKPARYKGDSYAELLNSYFCCITSSSIFNYVIAKYFEIPATGSLLLANETNDLKRVGFVPNRHYVPITEDNVLTKISQCLKEPEKYDCIRREGMEFVRKNHSVNNRMDELKGIFDDLLK